MPLPNRPIEWADRLAKLYTPVVADVLDKLGFRNQSMNPRVRPLWPEANTAGFALTVQTAPAREQSPAQPYAGELAAVDSLRRGDVLVVSESACSFWGELLSTAATYRGCRGVVLDGPTRDSLAIRGMGFPVFHVGFHPADSLGRLDVVAHNVPISCADVLVSF
ncbi:RraA family protein [Gemmata sp. JC673]|uniref:Putative 4-hydroxy-4-methyl-2-oxoglutarate aldolase n=1 Tax=Gemmata algarum TaxID=2975278 RepID=A0ABU5F6A2_9BACT|nr:RraA family protein [Gemmata algarum]MDY3563103.1 RraA family protein [Gemmata algarum]